MPKISLELMKNSLLAFTTRTGSQAASALLFVLLARQYGAEAAGVFTLAVRFSLLFLTLAAWGLDALLIRQLAADHTATKQYLANYGLLRLVGGIAAYLALVLVVVGILDYSAPTTRFILMFSLAIVPEGMNRLIQAAFMSQERFVQPTLVVLSTSAVRLLAAGAVLWMGGRLELLAAIQIGTSILSWVLYAVLLRHRDIGLLPDMRRKKAWPGSAWRQALDGRFLREQARLSVPFALMEVFLMVEWQIDIVLVSVFLSEREVGTYGAALTLVSLFYFALSAYSQAIYPVMTRLYQGDREKLWSLYRRLVLYVAVAVMPLTVLVMGAAPWLTTMVFGAEFAAAALALQWLVCSVAIRFFDEPNSRLIIIAGHQKEAALFLGLSMALNIGANWLLIPRYGIIGSAWARLLSTLLFVVLNGVFVYGRVSHINLLPTIGKLALALGAMGAVLYATQGSAVWLRAVLGGAAYVIALALVRYVPGEDRRRAREAAVRCWQRVRSPASR